MQIQRRTKLAAVALVVLALGGCSGPCSRIERLNAPALQSGGADFSRYVAMGTSISAGFQSGGLVENHQARAFPALFAQAIGQASFTYPAISPDGIPPLLELVSLSPLIVRPGTTMGVPLALNQPTPYDDMGVPGALLFDVADSAYYYGNPFGRSSVYFDLIVRHRGTILQQSVQLLPTFVSFEYGANEVLGPALQGSGNVQFPVALFSALLDTTLSHLLQQLPNLKIAIFNVPDVTTIPFVTTIPPFIALQQGNVALIGPDGPLAPNDHVLLTASDSLAVGTGVPVALGGNGRPLLDQQVLNANETAALENAQNGYNAAIAAAASRYGAALVDLEGLLREAATTGFEIRGIRYTSAYITGGVFSLDGVHPSDLAHAIIANTMIDAVNAKFGASIPHVSLNLAAPLAAARPAGISHAPTALDARFLAMLHGRPKL